MNAHVLLGVDVEVWLDHLRRRPEVECTKNTLVPVETAPVLDAVATSLLYAASASANLYGCQLASVRMGPLVAAAAAAAAAAATVAASGAAPAAASAVVREGHNSNASKVESPVAVPSAVSPDSFVPQRLLHSSSGRRYRIRPQSHEQSGLVLLLWWWSLTGRKWAAQYH